MVYKDKLYITNKLLKKMAIPFVLLVVVISFSLFCFFNNFKAYAEKQLAVIDMSVNLIEGSESTQLALEQNFISDVQSYNLDLSTIDVNFNSKNSLEYSLSVTNLVDNICSFSIKLEDAIIENFLIEYQISETREVLNEFSTNILPDETLDLKIFLCIDDISTDAILSGNLVIDIEELGV